MRDFEEGLAEMNASEFANGSAIFTETKAVTSYWFDEADLKGAKVGTWS